MDDTIRHMTPDVLREMQAIPSTLPTTPFEPHADWTHCYRIWMSKGKGTLDNAQSETIGFLKISKQLHPSGETFQLQIHQHIFLQTPRHPQFDGYHSWQEIKANMHCRNNALGSPIDWERTEHVFREQKSLPSLTVEEKGNNHGDHVTLSRNAQKTMFPLSHTWTSDWNLFECCQRIAPTVDKPIAFTLFEKLKIAKAEQRIYENPRLDTETRAFGKMKGLSQTGRALLPFDYWLDAEGRLQFVTNCHIAYILDPDAEAKVQHMTQERVRYRFVD